MVRDVDAQKMLGIDHQVISWCASKPNLLVSHFLIHSYLYYVLDASIIKDATFRWIGQQIKERWEDLEHPHKALIDPQFTRSGFYLKEYPSSVIGAARSLAASCGA